MFKTRVKHSSKHQKPKKYKDIKMIAAPRKPELIRISKDQIEAADPTKLVKVGNTIMISETAVESPAPAQELPFLISAADFATMTGKSVDSIYRLIKNHQIPSSAVYKFGKGFQIDWRTALAYAQKAANMYVQTH